MVCAAVLVVSPSFLANSRCGRLRVHPRQMLCRLGSFALLLQRAAAVAAASAPLTVTPAPAQASTLASTTPALPTPAQAFVTAAPIVTQFIATTAAATTPALTASDPSFGGLAILLVVLLLALFIGVVVAVVLLLHNKSAEHKHRALMYSGNWEHPLQHNGGPTVSSEGARDAAYMPVALTSHQSPPPNAFAPGKPGPPNESNSVMQSLGQHFGQPRGPPPERSTAASSPQWGFPNPQTSRLSQERTASLHSIAQTPRPRTPPRSAQLRPAASHPVVVPTAPPRPVPIWPGAVSFPAQRPVAAAVFNSASPMDYSEGRRTPSTPSLNAHYEVVRQAAAVTRPHREAAAAAAPPFFFPSNNGAADSSSYQSVYRALPQSSAASSASAPSKPRGSPNGSNVSEESSVSPESRLIPLSPRRVATAVRPAEPGMARLDVAHSQLTAVSVPMVGFTAGGGGGLPRIPTNEDTSY